MFNMPADGPEQMTPATGGLVVGKYTCHLQTNIFDGWFYYIIVCTESGKRQFRTQSFADAEAARTAAINWCNAHANMPCQ